jgi:superfamily II DNA helicase RecQ
MYLVKNRSDLETDFSQLLSDLQEKLIGTPRVIVYCNSLMMCADLFSHFNYEMGRSQYYPPGTAELSDNRLFGMFHARTPQHSKDVIIKSLLDPQGKMRVVFASVAMGMGIDLQGVNTIIHYGAPSSIEDYFQASGRGGRSGDSAQSIVYWTPVDCPMRKEPSTLHHKEVNDIRRYLENTSVCRRKWLLDYFDPKNSKPEDNPTVCCDVCAAKIASQQTPPTSNTTPDHSHNILGVSSGEDGCVSSGEDV